MQPPPVPAAFPLGQIHYAMASQRLAGGRRLRPGVSSWLRLAAILTLTTGTALIGGLLAVRKYSDRDRRREAHTTVQTPVVPPPAGVDTAAY